MTFLRSAVIRVALASALVTLPAAAAPGAFTLTGTPSCSVLTPAIVFQWTPSFGATSYELIPLSAPLSNTVTVTVPDTVCEGPVPDLTAIDIEPVAISGRVGDTIPVYVELANLGIGTSLAATARVRFGRGLSMSLADPVLGTISLPALTSGAVITQTMNVKLPPLAAGTYHLFLSLDEEHVSGEQHLGDDVKTSGAFTLADMPRRRAATH